MEDTMEMDLLRLLPDIRVQGVTTPLEDEGHTISIFLTGSCQLPPEPSNRRAKNNLPVEMASRT